MKTAIVNAGYKFPARRITVNLAPANQKKVGTAFDQPIALGILAAINDWGRDVLKRFLFVGELSLDGQVRPVRGTISLAMMARTHALKGIVVPEPNASEAGVVREIEVRVASSLASVSSFLAGAQDLPSRQLNGDELAIPAEPGGPDLSEVKGQAQAKRALEIAAAGVHNLLGL